MSIATIETETFWNQLGIWLSTPSLQLFLLVGSTVLAVAVLILSLTRLGHARPVMKCVVLSIVAHILLLGYAYGTRLILRPSVAEKVDEETVAVQLVGYEVEAEEKSEPVQEEPIHPWDDFSTDQPAPEIEALARPSFESELELKRTVDPESKTPQLPVPLKDLEPQIADVTKIESPRFDAAPLDSAPGFDTEDDDAIDDPEASGRRNSI